MTRHGSAATWVLPPADRPALDGGDGVERLNLRELVARPDRYEHHLVIVATVAGVQLEVATASEPLYFAHVNISDEYAMALPTGDAMIDAFPLRTFLADAATGADTGRYNHRVGDLVLHPVGALHWPGRLRPPYAPFEFAPGLRRCALSLVYCASRPTPATEDPGTVPADRVADAKAYAAPGPRMALAPMTGAPGVIARVGATELALVVRPAVIEAPTGAWVVVLAASGAQHAACDLLRVPPGARLDGAGIERALVLTSPAAPPDPVPPAWTAFAPPVFAPAEDAAPGALPFREGALVVETAADPSLVRARVGDVAAEVPRYWLARMVFRVGLHGIRIGYVETYGGFFVDDHAGLGDVVELGVRGAPPVRVARVRAAGVLEALYRAVAPPGHRERI